tara:strand:+ start:562 stop:927 length:366 start_codon:yes stop_codon:yes gene_type:complete
MKEEIKWSKKEMVERPFLNLGRRNARFKNREPIGGTYEVNVYHWEDYRLEKELKGASSERTYHIAKDNSYLCDSRNGTPEVKWWFKKKDATRHLKYILENDLMDKEFWANPEDGFIWGLMA